MLYPLSYGSNAAFNLHAAAPQATESPRPEPTTFTGPPVAREHPPDCAGL